MGSQAGPAIHGTMASMLVRREPRRYRPVRAVSRPEFTAAAKAW